MISGDTTSFRSLKSDLAIRQAVQPDHPFTVTGATGAILGLQNGSVEIWDLPTKVLGGLRLKAEVDGYRGADRPYGARGGD